MTKQMTNYIFALVLMLGHSPLLAQNSRPMKLSDLALLKGVYDPQFSPDGTDIAFVVSHTDIANNESTQAIMLAATDGKSVRRLTDGAEPRWSPDGKLIAYWNAVFNEKDQAVHDGIWLYDVASKQSRFLVTVHYTDHFLGHAARKNFTWSPDGQSIAYVGAEPPKVETAEHDKTITVITRTLFKTRTGFSDNRLTHVWLVPVLGGEPTLLTPGTFDEHSISWSPNGNEIAFVSSHSQDTDLDYRDDLWSVNVKSKKLRRLTDSTGTVFAPAWSPDGKHIAYLATARPFNTKDSPPEDRQLYVIQAEGGEPRNLTAIIDQRINALTWQPNSQAIYFTSQNRGSVPISRVVINTGDIETVSALQKTVRGFGLSSDGQMIAYTQTSLVSPTELWTSKADGSDSRKLTQQNDHFLSQVQLSEPETVWFKSFDGTPIQGWLMKPIGFHAGRKYPLILSIHGGPHGMYSYSFSARIQWLSANGYGVLFVNPRGSTGYGQAFSDGCVLNWGGGDYQDLMAAVDYAIAKNFWIDADRLGVTGGSYGGFMTNWVITQTNRFKAAVAVASLSNLISFYGTSLYHLLIEVEFAGFPWDNYPLLWQWSPLAHIKNVKTPTLFLHGEIDHDVPISQAEEMYVALRKLGVETVLVRYAGEGHGFRQPKNQVDYLRRTVEWFDRFVK